jgi:hypothetical protein
MDFSQQRRILALRRIADHIGTHPLSSSAPLHDIYQFGVLMGHGLRAWLEAMEILNVSTVGRRAFGFDSFQGMPEEDDEFMRPLHRANPSWHAGGLNAARISRLSDWPSLRARLVNYIGFDPERTTLVRGFYNESLREGASLSQRLGMRPALLLDIDCDLYTSSRQALRFMLQAGLLVPGSFVYYDDYSIEAWNWPTRSHPHKEERLAHEEVTEEFNLTWTPLFRHQFQGPLKGMEWISQWSTNGTRMNSRPLGRQLSAKDLVPVLQLHSCGRCGALRL